MSNGELAKFMAVFDRWEFKPADGAFLHTCHEHVSAALDGAAPFLRKARSCISRGLFMGSRHHNQWHDHETGGQQMVDCEFEFTCF